MIKNRINIGDLVRHVLYGDGKLIGTVLEKKEIYGRVLVFWHQYNSKKFVEIDQLERVRK